MEMSLLGQSLLLFRESHLCRFRILYPKRHFQPDSQLKWLELDPPTTWTPRIQRVERPALAQSVRSVALVAIIVGG